MLNQFPKQCVYCKERCGVGEGQLWKHGRVWYCAHPDCAKIAMAQALIKKNKEVEKNNNLALDFSIQDGIINI